MVGKPAPPVVLEYLWFAGNAETTELLAQLEGKPVVLEFWTTWCAPCIAAMPHLTSLASQFGGQVQFISISNEDTATINRFLAKRRPAGWVGTDTDNSVLGPYGVTGFPTTVLLSANHTVLGSTHPNELTPESLQNLIAGTWAPPTPSPVPVSEPKAADATTNVAAFKALLAAAPTTHLLLKPAPVTDVKMAAANFASGLYVTSNTTARAGYAAAFYIDESQIKGPEALLNTHWEVAANLGTLEKLKTLLIAALDSALGLRSSIAEEYLTTYTARLVPGIKPSGLLPAQATADSSTLGRTGQEEGLLIGKHMPLSALLTQLAGLLGGSVFDETGLTGLWEWDLSWDPRTGTEGLVAACREQLGVELVPAVTLQSVVRLVPR